VRVSIIIPVYADWASLSSCLKSVEEHVDLEKHKVVLVNDCGPEADSLEKNIKTVIKGKKGFEYFRNPKNLGFVGTCNRAVAELDKTNNDILLLNSDTEVTDGFLEEMLAVLASDKNIGAVTPRSNNATIATVPLSAAPQKGISTKKSFEIWKKIKMRLPRYSVVPTAHGFCMLIRRELIKKYGLFDEIFGRGYGEENDFCLRIYGHGYKSVLANRAYVFHLEARSFTSAAKADLVRKNRMIIDERYPEYTQMVRDYIKTATAEETRIEQSLGIKSYKPKLFRKIKNKIMVR
jgi:GT2 family glycosyltransferase